MRQKKIYQYPEDTDVGRFERSQAYRQRTSNLVKIGFNFNNNLYDEYYRIRNILYKEYWDNEGSQLTLMKKFNIPSSRTIYGLFNNFNIPRRSFSESGILSIKSGRRHLPCIDSRKIFHHGLYINNQGIKCYLRSDLEFRMAKKLDELNIPFETESKIEYYDSQEGTIRSGFPDFYLPELNLYIEMKGDWLLDNINLEDRWKSIKEDHKNFIILDFKTNNKNHILNKLIEYYYSEEDKIKIKNKISFIWNIKV